MALIAYIGPLVILSYFMYGQDAFAKFHIKQGLVLFVIDIAIWIIGSVFPPFWFLYNIINLAIAILAIIGIINVINGRERELPLVGKFASKFSF